MIGIVFYLELGIVKKYMLKEALHIVVTKPLAKDFVNCSLSYVLAQPVEIDLAILGIFVLQYVGVGPIAQSFEKLRHLFLSDENRKLLIPSFRLF
jgi:hypothetical protein